MADVEMEVDLNRPLGGDTQADEDLIDFDTDMMDDHDDETMLDTNTQDLLHEDQLLDEPMTGDEDHNSQGFHGEQGNQEDPSADHDVDLDAVDDDLIEEHDQEIVDADIITEVDNLDPADDTLPQPSLDEQKVDKNHAQVSAGTELHEEHVGDDEVSTHEIDYEADERRDAEDADRIAHGSHNHSDEGVVVAETGAEETEGIIENQDVDSAPHEANLAAEHGDSTNQEQGEQDEITWDDYEGHEDHEEPLQEYLDNGTEDHLEALSKADEDQDGALHDDVEAVEGQNQREDQAPEGEDGIDHHHATDPQQTEDDALEHQNHVVPEADQEEIGKEQRDDGANVAGAEHSEHEGSLVVSNGDSDFPAITVQYKGDEYPCFSVATEGFFTDTSVLDETMEVLLTKFRAELANEISHEDELVFQIDELGLEFAESSLRDSLSSVTMRQILEIFDLLVKNQDPDSSRTLYTYLFTKPSTSRRLEFLIESATAGKGLDEVIHLFESPMPNSTSMLEAGSIPHAYGEDLEAYESPDDLVDADTQEAQNENDESEKPELFMEDSHEAGTEGNEQEGDIETHAEEHETTHEKTAEDESHQLVPELPEHIEENESDEADADPFINLELDENIDDQIANDDEIRDDSALDTELGNIANTSTTTTLRGDDDVASVNVDVHAGVTVDEPAETTLVAASDELAEIDWSDEPGDDGAPDTPSGIGKRSRADDDELGVEDEKDVKRRRS